MKIFAQWDFFSKLILWSHKLCSYVSVYAVVGQRAVYPSLSKRTNIEE